MDPKPIQQRLRRTTQVARFRWRVPTPAPLRRALRELTKLGDRLRRDLRAAAHSQKEARPWSRAVLRWRTLATAVVKEIAAAEPSLAAFGAARAGLSTAGFLARAHRLCARLGPQPAAIRHLYARLLDLLGRLTLALQVDASTQRVVVRTEEALARYAKRWDRCWAAAVVATAPLRAADRRVARLFA